MTTPGSFDPTRCIKTALAKNGGGATESNPLILYDLISKNEPKAWSPNTWNVRYVLNLKGIPYKTHWLRYVDIKDTFLGLGLGPSTFGDDGSPHYTVPAISDPSKVEGEKPTLLVDSARIAQYLDAKYPTPPLFPPGSSASTALFVDWAGSHIMSHLVQLVVPLIHPILDEEGADYFHRTRSLLFGGLDLKDVNTDPVVRAGIWEEFKIELNALDAYYEKSGGLFWAGNEPTYPDVVMAAYFTWMTRVRCDQARDNEFTTPFDKIKDLNGGRWARLMEYFETYKHEP